MADQGQTRRRTSTTEGEAAERRDTKRMVLKRERVLVLADPLTDEQAKQFGDLARKLKLKGGPVTEAWVEMGEQVGTSKQLAIEAHAGKPNTPDAKPGEYKAPGMTAWKGGRRYVKPPETKVEAEDIE